MRSFNISLIIASTFALQCLISFASGQVFDPTCPASGYKQCSLGTSILVLNNTNFLIRNCIYELCPQIYALNTSLVINNVTFLNSLNPSNVVEGGALRMYPQPQNNITITNVRFEGNYLGTDSYGGGLYINGQTNFPITMINSTFVNNAADRGGGFFFKSATSNIVNVWGSRNVGTVSSGAGYIYFGTANITNAYFQNNVCVAGIGADLAFYIATAWVKNFTSDNSNANFGTSFAAAAGSVSIDGGYCNGGYARSCGSCGFVFGFGLMTIQNFRFLNGISGGNGGALCSNSGNIVLIGNPGTTGNSISTLMNSNTGIFFYNNSASTGGGGNVAFYGTSQGAGDIRNVVFSDGRASFGSDLAVLDPSSVKLSGCVAYRGNASVAGGSIYSSTASTISLSNVTISGSSAVNRGGAIAFDSNPMVNITGTNFLNTLTAGTGGALYVAGPTSTAGYFGSLIFKNCSAGTIGGALYVNAGNFTGSDFTMTGNSAGVQGGDLYAQNQGNLTIARFRSTNANSVNGSSVSIGSNCTLASFTDSSINGTRGAIAGGAIYYASSGTLSLSNFVLSNLTASFGSGIYTASGNMVNLLLSNGKIIGTGNPALNATLSPGSGLYLASGGSATLNQVAFQTNYAYDFYVANPAFSFSCMSGCSSVNRALYNCTYVAMNYTNVAFTSSDCDRAFKNQAVVTTTTTPLTTTTTTTTTFSSTGTLTTSFTATTSSATKSMATTTTTTTTTSGATSKFERSGTLMLLSILLALQI